MHESKQAGCVTLTTDMLMLVLCVHVVGCVCMDSVVVVHGEVERGL